MQRIAKRATTLKEISNAAQPSHFARPLCFTHRRIKRRLERCNESFTLGRLVNEEGDDSEELSLEGIVTKKWLDENRKRRTVMRKTEVRVSSLQSGSPPNATPRNANLLTLPTAHLAHRRRPW